MNSAFFALILAVKTPSKELIPYPFEMTNYCSEEARQGQFFFLLLEYSSAHLHTDLRTICFLTRFTVQYGVVGQKAGYKNALSHYTTPPLLFFIDYLNLNYLNSTNYQVYL